TTVSVIDLGTRAVVATVPVGSAAFGVDVDQRNQIAVVADYGSNDITLVRIPNPKPRVDDVSPKTFSTGGGTITLTVKGVGFVPTSVVTLNGKALPTTYISSTELHAELSSAAFNQALQGGVTSRISSDLPKGQPAVTPPPPVTVGVTSPGPGGGNSDPPADGNANLQVQNAVPVLLSLSPTSIQAGTTDLTLTLNGNNFNATSIVNFGSAQFSPNPATLTPTSMTVVIPQNQLTA